MRGNQHTKLFKTQTGMFFRKYSLYFFLFLLLLIIPLLIYFSMNWDAKRIVDGLSVEGNEYVPKETIESLIADSLYKKEKGKIELGVIRKGIEDYPFVKKADVMFAGNGKLKIVLRMRKPIARFGDGKGNLHFSDENGLIMPYLFFDNFSRLPLLKNCFKGQELDTAKFNTSLSVLKFINGNYDVVSGLLSEIIVRDDSKIDLVLNKKGTVVILGDTVNLKNKLDKLEIFLRRYLQTNPKREIKSIDLRWSRQAVVF